MSERFNDLARRAGATNETGHRADDVFCLTKAEMDEFCQLVLQECAEIINGDIYCQLDKNVRSNVFGLNQARDLITQHFNNPNLNFRRHKG